jgi:dihydroxyacetone kinase-like protein
MIGLEKVLAWLRELAVAFAKAREELTALDAAIGDADHGINMDRGFAAVAADLRVSPPADIASALKAAAMALIRTVGGAAGPLYGTFFLRASAACAGKAELFSADWVAAFRQGVEGVRQRGKAEPGDKTMLDTLLPAAEAMREAVEAGQELPEVLRRAEGAAEAGMKATIPLQARKGRASYLGERSVGHQDPGATTAHQMIRAAADTQA